MKMNETVTKRTTEKVLGILGGTFGIIAGIFAIFMGSLGDAFQADGTGAMYGLGFGCIIASFLAIIFSCLINKNRVVMGILLLICGVLNFVFVSMFGILSGLLILISGILALVRK
ncbi:DUF4064 domain-containing protein [Listeria costaricensis]|uniref:DUF4064 domain-containing protein n=1 Tax=Listeria costaricensis TaxID=2026604 RepID=UPI000C06B0F0|nr:DUF4064 domain-containing protein [Listeria costaricensis]